jgi:drug/metabolite transporter (DMT)-like permease
VRPTRREILALVSGFIGIVILTRGPAAGGDPLHFVILLLSPLLWALGSLFARGLKSPAANDPLLMPAMQMITGGIVMLIIAPLHGEHLPTHVSLWSGLAFAYCVVFGSLITFTAYSWLLRNTRPIIATSYAFVNPTIAVLLGAAIHGEALGVNVLIANAMMVIAIWLAVSRTKTTR